ncbi:MAG TPA: LptF/LptG family permease [Spirochaetota bacterium]|nr:LptF/LptG family permease [Spirochaetota bacterium]
MKYKFGIPRIYWYVFRQCIWPFLIGAVFFTIVLILPKVPNLVQLTVEKSTPLHITLQLFLYTVPFTAAITVPMGLLFGILMAFGNLSANFEIIAMRSNGISVVSIFIPVAVLSIITTYLMFLLINYGLPVTNYRWKVLHRHIVHSNPGILLDKKIFTKLPNTPNQKLASYDISSDGILDSVFIYENNQDNNKIKITYAETGELYNNDLNSPLINLRLKNGRTLELGWENFKKMQNLEYDVFDMYIINDIKKIGDVRKGYREMPYSDIWKEIRFKLARGQKIAPHTWVEFHKKFSLPLACIIFALIAMPLGISFIRSGRGISFGSAIIIIFAYYIFMTLGETLGTKKIISPHLSMWLPNIVIFMCGAVIFFIRARE